MGERSSARRELKGLSNATCFMRGSKRKTQKSLRANLKYEFSLRKTLLLLEKCGGILNSELQNHFQTEVN